MSAADAAVTFYLPLLLPTRGCLDFPTRDVKISLHGMSRFPYKKESRTPYKKSLTLLTDRTPDFWYNGDAQIASGNIEALVVTVVREGGGNMQGRQPISTPGAFQVSGRLYCFLR